MNSREKNRIKTIKNLEENSTGLCFARVYCKIVILLVWLFSRLSLESLLDYLSHLSFYSGSNNSAKEK